MRISMNKIWRNLDGPPKNKDLWSYVVKFEFSRPKVAQDRILNTTTIYQAFGDVRDITANMFPSRIYMELMFFICVDCCHLLSPSLRRYVR